MSAEQLGGLALILLAGVLAGNCMLPMKFARRWKWENTWLVFSLISLVVLPWALALLLAGDVMAIYRGLTLGQWLLPCALGAGWGVAQVLFGLSIARLGLALGCAIIIGLGSLFGTLVPLFFQNRAVLGTARGALILSGLAVMVAGIIVSARAGRSREQGQGSSAGQGYALALAMAVVCGLLAPMVNYSFAFGQPIAERAVSLGVASTRAGYASGPSGCSAGCCRTGLQHLPADAQPHVGSVPRAWAVDAAMAALMGVFWMARCRCTGWPRSIWAPGHFGGMGVVPDLQHHGRQPFRVLTGEWKEAPAGAQRTLYAGLALLAVATVILAAGNR